MIIIVNEMEYASKGEVNEYFFSHVICMHMLTVVKVLRISTHI